VYLITIGVLFSMMIGHSQAYAVENLKIAFPTKQVQLDPQKIEDLYSMLVVSQLYAKLFKYTPDGQIRSDLVERWKVSKDKKTYTFHLKAAKFSDGSPITATHVANSLKRIFILKASLSSDLAIIRGAQAFAKSNKIDELRILALDQLTLQIETENPTSLLLYLLAVPDVGVLKINDPANEIIFGPSMAFSGAYKAKSISPERIALQKWRDSDLESSNPPQEIEFNLFEKIDPDKVALGKITDTSSFMTFDEGKSPLENNSDWRAVASEAANDRYIIMNPNKVPENVRKWMQAKVRSEDFVKTLDDKSIVPAFGFIPTCLPGHLKKSKVENAPELKLEKSLTVKITHGANLPYVGKFRAYLTKVWAHPKLNLDFEVLPVSEYLKLIYQKEGTVIIGARGLDYPEGYSVVSYFRSDIESNCSCNTHFSFLQKIPG
jgi:ABC-type transport system substrate-binding protein